MVAGLPTYSCPFIIMKFCAVCSGASARVFCAADQAYLCGDCDSKVHNNSVSCSHERFPLCVLCEDRPAQIFCRNDDAYLCESCDAEIHLSNPLAARHERVPVSALCSADTPSSQPCAQGQEASVAAAASSPDLPVVKDEPAEEPAGTGAPDASPKSVGSLQTADTVCSGAPSVKAEEEQPSSEGLAMEELLPQQQPLAPKGRDKELDAFLDWDGALLDFGLELDAFEHEIMSNSLATDGVVPIAEPSESSCCSGGSGSDGKKQESVGSPSYTTFTTTYSGPQPMAGLAPQMFSVPGAHWAAHAVPQYAMPMAMNPIGAGWPAAFGAAYSGAYPRPEEAITREARHLSIKRYREKRNRRIFEKTIRYQSRKAYAEIRPRIKGRFAKREEVGAGAQETESDSIEDLADDRLVPVCANK